MMVCRALLAVAIVGLTLHQAGAQFGGMPGMPGSPAARRRRRRLRRPPPAPPPQCQELLTIRDELQKHGKAIEAANQQEGRREDRLPAVPQLHRDRGEDAQGAGSRRPEVRRAARRSSSRCGAATPRRSRSASRSATPPPAGPRPDRPDAERRARHRRRRCPTRAKEGRRHLRNPDRQSIRAMSDAAGRVADSTGNWVDSLAPAWLRPYLRLARLDRPIGSWLLLIPCWWSLGLAGDPCRRAGQRLARRAVLHRRLRDARRRLHLERHRRPRSRRHGRAHALAADSVGAGERARRRRSSWSLQALVGLAVLLQFNGFTVWTGIASLAIVAIYPFMKRITYWPQIVLGLAFSWGALMGWPATFGRLDWPALVLYAGVDRLGDRLRHHLCASGSRGRRADRDQVDRASCSARTPSRCWRCSTRWRSR